MVKSKKYVSINQLGNMYGVQKAYGQIFNEEVTVNSLPLIFSPWEKKA
jgi:hypothetical protein